MSTQEIGALIKSVNDMTATVGNKISDIDHKVNEATNAVPDSIKKLFDLKLYVNELTGSDLNDGLTPDRPLKYINMALSKSPSGGKVYIVIQSTVTAFTGSWELNDRTKHYVRIEDGRTVFIDFMGHDLIINTSHFNSWSEGHINEENPCIDKTFMVSINSFLQLHNGHISISARSGDEGKALYSHTSLCCLFNNDSSRTQLSNMRINSNITTVGLFGLDNWGSMGYNVHLRDSQLTGVGILKRVINDATAADMVVKKINVSSTWTE